MRRPFAGAIAAAGLSVVVAACGTPRPATAPVPAAPAAPAGPAGATAVLPPIPHVTGPIAISVVYPRPGALITSRDSNFIFGSVGTGDATLTINGTPVPVRANGAFLAWLPVPDSAASRYDLVAVQGADTVRATHPVRVLPPVSLQDTLGDTVAALPRPFPDSNRYVTIASADTSLSDTDRAVIARPVAGGTYKWFLFSGTVLQVTGRSPGYERVRLDEALDAWISLADVRTVPLPAGARLPQRVVGAVRVEPAAGWEDVVLAVGERPPYLVEEDGDDLVLTLYSTQASTSLIHYVGRLSGPPGPPDTLVESVTWSQETRDRARYTIHLSRPPYGYLAMWTASGFVLRVRRPPVVDAHTPLTGLTIAIDAGHPPAGSTGPTGLYEPVPTLAIAQQVEAMLIAHGAAVVMTRTTPDPVNLNARPVMARRFNANALVSIHLNALPDGMNPFVSHGTGSYFFQPHSITLARAVQTGMVHEMGLRDLGIHYDNLALVRPTWMPAVLCEGAFIIIPEQEAALRTKEFQAAYARGVVEGLESYFRTLAAPESPSATASSPAGAPATTPGTTTPPAAGP
jgi:N-acetylmuramoyl-L-alanine amidase